MMATTVLKKGNVTDTCARRSKTSQQCCLRLHAVLYTLACIALDMPSLTCTSGTLM